MIVMDVAYQVQYVTNAQKGKAYTIIVTGASLKLTLTKSILKMVWNCVRIA
jgi:hypothetical protein